MSVQRSPELLLLNGPPWSGKTSIARYALQEGFLGDTTHLSVGDLKRNILTGKRDSAYRQQLTERNVEYAHHSVPSGDVITGIIEEFLVKRGDGLTIIDGYPRYPDRIAPFERTVSRLGARVIGLCVTKADESTLRQRSQYDRPGRPAPSETELNERLADYYETITPTISYLSEHYSTRYLDSVVPVADAAIALANICNELRA